MFQTSPTENSLPGSNFLVAVTAKRIVKLILMVVGEGGAR